MAPRVIILVESGAKDDDWDANKREVDKVDGNRLNPVSLKLLLTLASHKDVLGGTLKALKEELS